MIKIFSELKGNEQKTIILVAVLTLAVIFGYINLLLIPQAKKIIRVFSSAAKVRNDLMAAEALVARKDALVKTIEDYNKKIGRYEKTLPTEAGLPTLLEDLAEMAKDSKMRIVGIVPAAGKEGAARAGQAYREIPIAISAKSGYHELGRFLSRLQNCDRFMKVADIQVKGGKAAGNKHDVEILVLTYVLLEGK
ncbi:MAG: type 4a pilus biogenesis protein PilO [Candidatus Omnitrophica bacterium]|nr:type 4a pilus biogenesis protein PilO [Candidatus Omnitrophota bacterium]MCM8790442.1 type 4a pilus biogenesis protein PilO [Candidatus Omnitrophota bacterium]